LLALITNRIFKTDLKYGQLLKLSIYALTVTLIINTLFKILQLGHFRFYGLVYHAIACVYIGFALKKMKDSQDDIPEDFPEGLEK